MTKVDTIICGDKVRLGVTAPRSISVRREIYEAIQREKAEKAAAENSQNPLDAGQQRQ